MHRALLGETHVLIHESDCLTSLGSRAVMLRPAERLLGRASDDAIPHTVTCARCEQPLGTTMRALGCDELPVCLRLHKDRLWLPSWRKYTVASRLYTELTERASAHSQYRFMLHACDAVSEHVRSSGVASLTGTGVRGRLVLLTWTSAVAACPGSRSQHEHTTLTDVPALKLAFECFDEDPSESVLRCDHALL